MPPKPKFTKDEVIAVALNIVSEKGAEALTAQELKTALHSSASPIFTLFRSMKEIMDGVRSAAMERFEHFAEDLLPEMPPFKRIGMRMVLFGREEPKLYQLLFMQEYPDGLTFDDLFGHLGGLSRESMLSLQYDYALSPHQAKFVFENVWIYTFGIGALYATGVCRFSDAELGQMLTTQFEAIIHSKRMEELL